MSDETMVTVVDTDPDSHPARRQGIKVLRRLPTVRAKGMERLVYLGAARSVTKLSDLLATEARQPEVILLRNDAHSPQTLVDAVAALQQDLGVRVFVYEDPAVAQRVLDARRYGLGPELIADAEVLPDRVRITTADLVTIEVPITVLPALRGHTSEELADYEIDEDGSFIYWPQLDVHLGPEQFRQAIDPERKKAARLATLRHEERYGAAIRQVRQAHGLRQADIEGLSERQLSRIENGARPRLSTLEVLATAHGLSINDYLLEVATALRSAGGIAQP